MSGPRRLARGQGLSLWGPDVLNPVTMLWRGRLRGDADIGGFCVRAV